MKFIHIADVHINKPCKNSKIRKQKLFDAFAKMIKFIKKENIDYLFIAGDFYEHRYINNVDIKYIDELFKEIPNTKIYISPGNHDPYTEDSIYNSYKFSDNVHIFRNLDNIKNNDVNIIGYGFTNFESKDINIQDIKNKINNDTSNILLIHGDLNGSSIHNNMNVHELEKLNLDYIALGHIHKSNFNCIDKIVDLNKLKKENIYYSGSFLNDEFKQNFDETGVIYGKIDKNRNLLNLNRLHFDNTEYIIKTVDISKIENTFKLIMYLDEKIMYDENKYYLINLVGNKNFILDEKYILKNLSNKNILDIKDMRVKKINFENLRKENTLKGHFVNKCLNKIEELEKQDSINTNLEVTKIVNTMYKILDEMEN